MHVLLSYFGAYLNELQFTEKGCGANKITCPYLELLPVILARFGAQIQHIKFSMCYFLSSHIKCTGKLVIVIKKQQLLGAPDDQLLMGFEAISRFSAPTLKSLSIGSHHVSQSFRHKFFLLHHF